MIADQFGVKSMSDGERVNNPGSNPDSEQRRTGGSANDPHGGHEHSQEWRGPDPDPVDELVPAGAGSLPGTKNSVSEDVELSAYTDSQKSNIPGEIANVDGRERPNPSAHPGFGPTGFDRPLIEGNPELGIDPHDVRDERPPRTGQGTHAGS